MNGCHSIYAVFAIRVVIVCKSITTTKSQCASEHSSFRCHRRSPTRVWCALCGNEKTPLKTAISSKRCNDYTKFLAIIKKKICYMRNNFVKCYESLHKWYRHYFSFESFCVSLLQSKSVSISDFSISSLVLTFFVIKLQNNRLLA